MCPGAQGLAWRPLHTVHSDIWSNTLALHRPFDYMPAWCLCFTRGCRCLFFCWFSALLVTNVARSILHFVSNDTAQRSRDGVVVVNALKICSRNSSVCFIRSDTSQRHHIADMEIDREKVRSHNTTSTTERSSWSQKDLVINAAKRFTRNAMANKSCGDFHCVDTDTRAGGKSPISLLACSRTPLSLFTQAKRAPIFSHRGSCSRCI